MEDYNMKLPLTAIAVILVGFVLFLDYISKFYDHPPEYNICMLEGGDFIDGECVPRE